MADYNVIILKARYTLVIFRIK